MLGEEHMPLVEEFVALAIQRGIGTFELEHNGGKDHSSLRVLTRIRG